MEQRAPLLILSIIALVTLSNAFAVLLSYGIGLNMLSFLTFEGNALSEIKDTVTPLFSLNIPKILAPDRAMLLGIVVGLIFSFIKVPAVTKFTQNMLLNSDENFKSQ